jgi:D-alanyl-lipoteichoic acid acyltransferase DltB (MBOAT superfamily)
MLFNSPEFIFAFLPATIAGFLLFGTRSRTAAVAWLILASIFFYGWWRPFNLLIIGPSIVINFIFAKTLLHHSRDDSRSGMRSLVLAIGILFNIALLGYFKYANFAVIVANDLTGRNFVLEQVILPLGISFITFQKIAFLVDVAGRRVESFTVRDFLLFVLFFPQLIAGPIVHYREVAPQFQRATCRFDAELFAAALTLFCFGLFKKVVLADGIAQYVSPVFTYAAAGGPVTLMQAWLAAVGFTLQMYFDFSAYSDMACGAALFFGIRLPLNFDSPLKASSIIDFWWRWHVTLTRFLTAYIFNPIALALSRRRAAKALPMLGGRGSSMSAFFHILAWPTLATMLVSGAWHGAGYTFILWGLLHGLYLIGNHAWRQYGPRTSAKGAGAHLVGLSGFALTFLAVVFAMVLFRAPDVRSALNVFAGMIGLHGLGLPAGLAEVTGMSGLGPMTLLDGEVPTKTFAAAVGYLVALLAIALLLPNSLQVLSKHDPALHMPKRPSELIGVGAIIWRPTLPWMAFTAVLAALAMMQLTGKSEFLYWQF